MRLTSLLDIRFNMKATVLNDFASDSSTDLTTEVKGGHWRTDQDEITGGIKRVWVEDTVVATPVKKERGTSWRNTVGVNRFDIECYVRGFPEVGFRSSANNENFDDGLYKPFEAIQMIFPAKYVITRRQYVTNIRARNDVILWLEEETGEPTVFEVQGVTPTFDPFGRHIDNLTVLKRATVQ